MPLRIIDLCFFKVPSVQESVFVLKAQIGYSTFCPWAVQGKDKKQRQKTDTFSAQMTCQK